MYYIYHIKGKKIGCTQSLEYRLKRQNYTNCDILETHTDIMIASQREIELQKQYGYSVDRTPYYEVVKRASKTLFNTRSKGGKTQGIKNTINGQIVKIQKISAEKRKKPILQYTKLGQFIKEWDSASSAGTELSIIKGSITNCCNHKRKSAGGYVWKYKQ
jgi:hypothetical protein